MDKLDRDEYNSDYYEEHKEQIKEKRAERMDDIIKYSNDYNKRLNERTLEDAQYKYKRWADEERDILRHMHEMGFTDYTIAIRLGRTLQSIRNERKKLGI